jgi:alpha-glucosidase
MNLSKALFAIRGIGIIGIFRIIHQSILRDFHNKHFATPPTEESPIFPGSFIRCTPKKGGVDVLFENASVEVLFLSPNITRISWSPGDEPYPYTLVKRDWDYLQPKIYNNTNRLDLITDNISISIDNNGGINFSDEKNYLFRRDEPPIRINGKWSCKSHLKPEEHIYGLGERASALNLRPGNYRSWNSDVGGNYSTGTDPLYIGTPIYLSLTTNYSYLLYYENSFGSCHTVKDNYTLTFDGGMLRYYLITGLLPLIYNNLSELIGKPCMPPRWALGYHQCRWGYRSEKDIRDIADSFENHDLPISAIHLDIDYMDGYRVFSINNLRFPKMKQLTEDLDKKGIKLVASINPAVKVDPNFWLYKEGKQSDLFCKLPDNKILKGISWPGWVVFPDFSDPITREWWQNQYKHLIELGIAGFWHDMNEPASFSAWGDMTFPSFTRHKKEGAGGDHLEIHNLYGLLMNQAAYEGIRTLTPDKRPWIFSRSGWAGLQKYAWNWTGDVESSWQALKQTLTTILGLGLSGHAFSGADIGGFSGNPEAELYLRWFQMSTFFPLFRTHSAIGTKPREPWQFDETTLHIVRDFLKLRYKLLPYLYTTIWNSTRSGIPPIRPIYWNNQDDSTLWDIDDEFFLGDHLLIAPILRKGEYKRKIILPPGMWIYFWDDKSYVGQAQYDIKLSLDTIPVFIKTGSIIPLEENGAIALHIYPGENQSSCSQIFSDAGDGYGPWHLDSFTLNQKMKLLSITRKFEGDYVLPYSHYRVVVHGSKIISRATSDGVELDIDGKTFITPLFHQLLIYF